jgi:uncharacterized protein
MPAKKKRNAVTQKAASARQPKPDYTRSDLIEVRNSRIHGRGVYAAQPIKKGARIMEYVGERITHSEADRRFAEKAEDDGHTFLFVVNHRTVIDGSNHGNDARYINHRCEANCETVTEDQRIFIEATRDIRKGEELGYDYQLTWSEHDTPEDLALYRCLCGSKNCRGTMLDKLSMEANRRKERAKRERAKAREAAKGKSATKTKTKSKSKSSATTRGKTPAVASKKSATKPAASQRTASKSRGRR